MRCLLLISLFSACTVYAATTCEITGCNGELCMAKSEAAISTCLWKAEYQCYKQYGICEADAQGVCGWRQTPELVTCIQQAQYVVERADTYSD